MGRTSNYALIVARIKIPEEDGTINDYGLGMFLVQCRDLNTHKHMPGVTSGEIGPKIGFSSKDNGWMTFNHVRIPRENMLNRFMTIDDDGCFSMQGDPRAMYLVMLRTRISVLILGLVYQLQANVIGTRYSVVRRQFKNISGQTTETKLMDYQTQ